MSSARWYLICLCPALLAAVEVEHGKLATADASPLDPGATELSLGLAQTRASSAFDGTGTTYDRGGNASSTIAAFGVTHGLRDGLDASLGLGLAGHQDRAASPDHGSGLTDIALGAKWAFWGRQTADGAAAVALLPSITIPTGRRQDPAERIPTASRYWTGGATLAASGSVGRIGLNADAGYVHALGSADTRAGYRGTWTMDGAIGVQLSDALQIEADLSWAHDAVDTGQAPWSLTATAGFTYGGPHGRINAGLQRVVDGASTDIATTLLVTATVCLP